MQKQIYKVSYFDFKKYEYSYILCLNSNFSFCLKAEETPASSIKILVIKD